MLSSVPVFLAVAAFTPLASAHIAFWHKSMYGFNVSAQTYSYDNRPQTPLQDYTFDQWWFHGHLDHPPNDGDFFELPAGQSVNTELSCDKGTTSWFDSAPGGNSGYPTNYPCVGQPTSEFHTTGFDDVKGCALAISYKSDASSVQPEDFAVFSVNHTCVWYQNTAFQVPADMPPCPEGGCTCAWFWIHSPDSGSEQNYMNGFKCKVTGSTSNTAIGKPAVPRRCGADTNNGRQQATPSNCTAGPKQPFYWYQKERNTLFEGTYSPPFYLPLYNFEDGAQNDIFQEATVGGVPVFGGSGSAPVVSSAPAASSTPVTPSSTPASAPSSQAPAPSSQAPAPSSQAASPAPSSQAPAPAPSSQAAAPAPSSQAADPVPSSSPAPAPSSQAPPAASPSPAQPTTQASSQAPIPTPAPASPIAAPVQASSAVASQASSAPPASSTKQCKSKKKKRAAKNATLNARHDAIKRHVKRRLSQDELH